MTYTYTGYANAASLAAQLTRHAEQYAEEVADLQAAREEAVTALAGQIRAQRLVADDRALVAGEVKRQRDTRVALR